jgi:hypothetical protein
MSKRSREEYEQRVCDAFAIELNGLHQGSWNGSHAFLNAQREYYALCYAKEIPLADYNEFIISVQQQEGVTAARLIDFLHSHHPKACERPLLLHHQKSLQTPTTTTPKHIWCSHQSGTYLAPFKLTVFTSGNVEPRNIWYQYNADGRIYRSYHVPVNKTEILITQTCTLFVWDAFPDTDATMTFHFEMGKATLTPFDSASKTGTPILLYRPDVRIGAQGRAPSMLRPNPLEITQHIVLQDTGYEELRDTMFFWDRLSVLREHVMLSFQDASWKMQALGKCKLNGVSYNHATSVALSNQDIIEVICLKHTGAPHTFAKYSFSWQPNYNFATEPDIAAVLEEQLNTDDPRIQEEDASSDDS